jgi:hypothetical protein
MEIEHAVAAGKAVGKVCFNALIFNALIIEILIIMALTMKMLINSLILQTPIVETLIRDALRLITSGRFRSRIGSSLPVVFNLSIAQMLRLFSHWTHISII